MRLGRSSESQAATGHQLKFLFSDKKAVTITLSHFSAAVVFALFASIVFGITHRESTRDMVRYGVYCFAMFLGGLWLAGWAMWLLKR